MLPAARAGAIFQLAMVSGKFQGTMRPTTPSGSRNVTSTPPETGMESPSKRSGIPVVVEGLRHHRHLAAGVAYGLAGVLRLQLGQVLLF